MTSQTQPCRQTLSSCSSRHAMTCVAFEKTASISTDTIGSVGSQADGRTFPGGAFGHKTGHAEGGQDVRGQQAVHVGLTGAQGHGLMRRQTHFTLCAQTKPTTPRCPPADPKKQPPPPQCSGPKGSPKKSAKLHHGGPRLSWPWTNSPRWC